MSLTWIDFIRKYDDSITPDIAEYMLWNETAYPFCNLKIASYQLRSAIRARKNNISRCEICGKNMLFHKKNCFNT